MGKLPYPESLCHGCAAPPKYITTATSVFILCPIHPVKYPPQPVRACDWYRPIADAEAAGEKLEGAKDKPEPGV